MSLLRNAIYLAWTDTRARYKKSLLGPLWLTLGNLIGVLGLSLVWANLLKEDMRTFVPSLTIGMIVWQLVAGAIGDAPGTFVRQAGVIRNVAIPIWFFVVRALSRHIINLLHNLVIVVGVVVYFQFPVTLTSFLAIPGFMLVVLNLYWITYFFGMLGARFRDIEYLINSFLPLLFFVSPVIFRPDRLPVSMEVIWLNPLSYFIEVVRAPFLGQVPSVKTYAVMLALLVVGTTATIMLQRSRGKRIAFWI